MADETFEVKHVLLHLKFEPLQNLLGFMSARRGLRRDIGARRWLIADE
jgi:hypothetical protein